MSTPDQSEYNQDEAPAATAPTQLDPHRPRGSTRIPFDGVVEVGGDLGPPFEAQAVDVSGTGMHLRTAYLPEVGQRLSCRFETGPETVIAGGLVIWQREAGRGGEFGIEFVDLDPESATALERMTDRTRLKVPGAKVRLHIEGLGAPMRARVKGTRRSELTVGSELGFLQVGKHIDLEDAESGHRRPASIDRVEVEVDPSSRVPQLVVALKYEDVALNDDEAPVAAPALPDEGEMDHESNHDPNAIDGDSPSGDQDACDVRVSDPLAEEPMTTGKRPSDPELSEGMYLKGPVARAASKVTPALERFAKRTKTAAGLLIERARARRATESSPIRRTTAPAPGGSLHAAGRKVVRSEAASSERPSNGRLGAVLADRKKLMMLGASGVLAVIIGTAVMSKKSAAPPATPETNAAIASDTTNAASPGTAAQPVGAPAPVAAPAPVDPNATPSQSGTSSFSSGSPEPVAIDHGAVGGSEGRHGKKALAKVAPFSYGNVSHGNVLRLKMDGSIDKIQGAQQPTGFTVHIPGRRSLEPAAPLAARDARIGSIKVVNDPGGAELALTFKDGVPSYTVRAKGDQLEIVLATPNAQGTADGAHAKADAREPGAKAKGPIAKHGKGKRKHH